MPVCYIHHQLNTQLMFAEPQATSRGQVRTTAYSRVLYVWRCHGDDIATDMSAVVYCAGFASAPISILKQQWRKQTC